MIKPTVTFYVPDDTPPLLLEMFSADILAQLPEGTIAEIKHFIDQVEEIKAGFSDVSRQLSLFPKAN